LSEPQPGSTPQCRSRATASSSGRSSGKKSFAPSSSTTVVQPGIVSRSQCAHCTGKNTSSVPHTTRVGAVSSRSSGSTSMMCDCNGQGGWDCDNTNSLPDAGVCPAFSDLSQNGIKFFEQVPNINVNSGANQGSGDGAFGGFDAWEIGAGNCSQTSIDLNDPGYSAYVAANARYFPQNGPSGDENGYLFGPWLRQYSMVFEFLGGLALLGYIGFRLDESRGWSPWGMLTGLLLGMGVGLWRMIRESNRLNR